MADLQNNMNAITFKSFTKTAMALQADCNTPGDYIMIKAAVKAKYPKLKLADMQMPVQPQSRFSRFREAAKAEAGPATGAVLGAGVANMYGINPLAGAAAGYGLGAIPEVLHGFRNRVR